MYINIYLQTLQFLGAMHNDIDAKRDASVSLASKLITLHNGYECQFQIAVTHIVVVRA